jgi:hypothetical protein
MRKILFIFIFLFSVNYTYAGLLPSNKAKHTKTNTTSFNNILSTNTKNVQLALDLLDDLFQVTPPATPTSTGVKGQYAVDNDYFYICNASNIWERVAIATWSVAKDNVIAANGDNVIAANGDNVVADP